MIIKEGKTNWRYVLIVVILAAIVGGGILDYIQYSNREIISLNKLSEIKKSQKFEINKVEPPQEGKEMAKEISIMEYFNKHAIKLTSDLELPAGLTSEFTKGDYCKDKEEKTIDSDNAITDLNSDGIEEFVVVLIYVCDTRVAGATNAPILMYQKINNEWKKIGGGYGNGFAIEETKTDGYFDIMIHDHFTSYSGNIHFYKWDKTVSQYKKDKSIWIDCWESPEQCE